MMTGGAHQKRIGRANSASPGAATDRPLYNYLIVVAYDGSDFAGWQTQEPDAAQSSRTVQGEIERILSRIFRFPVEIHGSGRTDAGAHATGQTASFKLPLDLSEQHIARILRGALPPDIGLVAAHKVPLSFHARYHATGKTYVYKIRNAAQSDPFTSRYTHFIPLRSHRLDIDAMRRAASLFIGTHNFGSFMAMGSDKKNHVRTLFEIMIEERATGGSAAICSPEHADDVPAHASSSPEPVCGEPDREIHVRVTGSGFLYKMVRILVQTLIEYSAGQCTEADILRLLSHPEPARKKTVAPAHGLYLEDVYYEDGE